MKSWRIILKSALLFAALNLLFATLGNGFRPSIYNTLVPGANACLLEKIPLRIT